MKAAQTSNLPCSHFILVNHLNSYPLTLNPEAGSVFLDTSSGSIVISNQDIWSTGGLANEFWSQKVHQHFIEKLHNKNIDIKNVTSKVILQNADQSNTEKNCQVSQDISRDTPKTGLESLQFEVFKDVEMKINKKFTFRLLEVKLSCDLTYFPWCQCKMPKKVKKKQKSKQKV